MEPFFFVLNDMNGVNPMNRRQPELVGQNLIETRDQQRDPTIRMLIDHARCGGEFAV